MRRAYIIAVLLLAILGGTAIGIGAYHAGVSHGLAQAATGSQVVRVIGPGYGFGVFPFGFFLFPLFVIGTILLVRGLFWRRRWGGPGHPGSWGHDGPMHGRSDMFEDWHRRQHQQAAGDHPGSGGEPENV